MSVQCYQQGRLAELVKPNVYRDVRIKNWSIIHVFKIRWCNALRLLTPYDRDGYRTGLQLPEYCF